MSRRRQSLSRDSVKWTKRLINILKSGPESPNSSNSSNENSINTWKDSMTNWVQRTKECIDNGANINGLSKTHKQTPLMISCSHRINPLNNYYYEIINYIIDNNANINIIDKFGMTALHHACNSGQYYSVNILLNIYEQENNLSSFIDLRDEFRNFTPLQIARDLGNNNIVNLLINWGAIQQNGQELTTQLQPTPILDDTIVSRIDNDNNNNFKRYSHQLRTNTNTEMTEIADIGTVTSGTTNETNTPKYMLSPSTPEPEPISNPHHVSEATSDRIELDDIRYDGYAADFDTTKLESVEYDRGTDDRNVQEIQDKDDIDLDEIGYESKTEIIDNNNNNNNMKSKLESLLELELLQKEKQIEALKETVNGLKTALESNEKNEKMELFADNNNTNNKISIESYNNLFNKLRASEERRLQEERMFAQIIHENGILIDSLKEKINKLTKSKN